MHDTSLNHNQSFKELRSQQVSRSGAAMLIKESSQDNGLLSVNIKSIVNPCHNKDNINYEYFVNEYNNHLAVQQSGKKKDGKQFTKEDFIPHHHTKPTQSFNIRKRHTRLQRILIMQNQQKQLSIPQLLGPESVKREPSIERSPVRPPPTR
jgi:hypothetical protein